MKAITYYRYGPPEVLRMEEMPTPVPGDNEVLIRVIAAAVNRTDCGFREAEYFISRFFSGLFRPKQPILGNEFSGVVEAVGREVTAYRPGDEVFGQTGNRFGAHAEFLCLPENGAFTTKPAGISHTDAAAVCDGAMLGINILRGAKLKAGDQVMVYGASGSIGSATVQLAKHLGAEVTAVCSTRSREIIRSLGADRVIDYQREDYRACGQTFDLVADAVGKISFFQCRKLLKKNGVYIGTELGFLWQNVFLALLAPLYRGKKVRFPIPLEKKEDVEFFKSLLESGAYRAVIDRVYPMEEFLEATRYVQSGEKTGNVVMTVG